MQQPLPGTHPYFDAPTAPSASPAFGHSVEFSAGAVLHGWLARGPDSGEATAACGSLEAHFPRVYSKHFCRDRLYIGELLLPTTAILIVARPVRSAQGP